VYEKVNLVVDNLSRATGFPFALTTSIEGEGQLDLRGTLGPLSRDDMLLTPLKAALKINRFDTAASSFTPSDVGLSGMLDFSGDLNSYGNVIRSKGKASVANLRLINGGEQAGKPVSLDYDLSYNLKKKTGRLTDAAVGFGRAAMHLSGDFNASGDTTSLKMKLKGSGIPVEELQELLPLLGLTLPKGATLKGGTLNMELAAEGPLNNLIMDGSAAITETSLNGFDLGDKIKFIAETVGMKPSPDTLIEKLSTAMRWTTQGIAVNDIQLVIPAFGTLSGEGTISPQQELDFTMQATINSSLLAAFTNGNAVNVRFFVRGGAADPEFIPDYKDAARSLIDAALSGEAPEPGLTNKVNRIRDSLKGLLRRKE
jgi:hypothetical protein